MRYASARFSSAIASFRSCDLIRLLSHQNYAALLKCIMDKVLLLPQWLQRPPRCGLIMHCCRLARLQEPSSKLFYYIYDVHLHIRLNMVRPFFNGRLSFFFFPLVSIHHEHMSFFFKNSATEYSGLWCAAQNERLRAKYCGLIVPRNNE